MTERTIAYMTLSEVFKLLFEMGFCLFAISVSLGVLYLAYLGLEPVISYFVFILVWLILIGFVHQTVKENFRQSNNVFLK